MSISSLGPAEMRAKLFQEAGVNTASNLRFRAMAKYHCPASPGREKWELSLQLSPKHTTGATRDFLLQSAHHGSVLVTEAKIKARDLPSGGLGDGPCCQGQSTQWGEGPWCLTVAALGPGEGGGGNSSCGPVDQAVLQ